MQDIQVLESLIFQPEEAFKQLIKGSDVYYYFMFLKLFHEKGCDLSREEKDQLRDYIVSETKLSEKIKQRKLFLQLDKYQNDERRRKKIFMLLKKHVFQMEEDDDYDICNFSDVSREEEYEVVEELEVVEDQEALPEIDTENREEEIISNEDNAENIDENAENEESNKESQAVEQVEIKSKENEESEEKSGKDQSSVVEQAALENEENEENEYIPAELNNYILDLKAFMENYSYALIGLSSIEPKFFHLLDFDKLLSSPYDSWSEDYLNNAIDIQQNPKAVQIVRNFMKKKKPFQSYLHKLSLHQLQELGELEKQIQIDETYVLQIYEKQFSSQILDDSTIQKVYEIHQQAWNWSFKLAPKFKTLACQIIHELIQFSLENNLEIKLEWMFDYLKLNSGRSSLFIYEILLDSHEQMKYSNEVIIKEVQNNFNQFSQHYLLDHEDLSIFSQYIEQNYLKKIEIKLKLEQGKQVNNLQQYFNEETLTQMNNKKILKLKFNKQSFKHGENVNLKLEMKNIQSLKIKIFQINNENYCLQNKKNVDINIFVQGQMSNEERDFQYIYQPIEVFEKEFQFDSITAQKQGTFLIYFIGNGMTAKALINKGRLVVQSKITSAGHVFTILDENHQICSNKRTGLWLDGQFYQVNQYKEILVPFAQSQKTTQVVLVNDDYAEMATVVLQSEEYQLECPYIITEEQFVSDSTTEILLYPILKVASQEIDVRLLLNATIRISSINKQGAISYSQIEKVIFSNKKPFSVQIRNVSNLEKTEFTITGNLTQMKNNEYITLIHKFTVIYKSDSYVPKQYVKYTEEKGYVVSVLGRNGEAYENIVLEFSFHTIFSTSRIVTKLKTDSSGSVYLGKLENVTEFGSDCSFCETLEPPSLKYVIFKNKNQVNQINLKNLNIQSEQLIQLVQFEIAQPAEQYKVIVIASNFLSKEENENQYKGLFLKKQQQTLLNQAQEPLLENQQKSNQSQNGETQYAINRKNQPPYIGNTLEKPGLLLCRQFNRETNQQQEDLNEDESSSEDEGIAGKKKKMKKLASYKPPKEDIKQLKSFFVSTHQNFLKAPAQVIYLDYNESHQYSVKLDDHYAQVSIIIVTENEFARIPIGLKQKDIYKKDISHQSQLKEGKFYSTQRETILLQSNEISILNDFANKNYAIIDSYETAFKALSKLKHQDEEEIKQNIYYRWGQLDINQKIKLYNENLSDELNIFLYFKDPSFLDVYVKPFINNKIEKSFIDYFLLQNVDNLLQFSQIGRFNKLNALEKCLLFIYFNELNKNEQLVERMKNHFQYEYQGLSENYNQNKKQFDSVIGCVEEQVEGSSDSERGGGGGGPPDWDRGGGGGGPFYNIEGCCYAGECGEGGEEEEEEDGYCKQQETRARGKRRNYDDEDDRYNRLRKMNIQPFKNIKPTCEYCESHYHDDTQLYNSDRLSFNKFYYDIIQHSVNHGIFKVPFLSENFIYNDINYNESNLPITMAFLGLPYQNNSQVKQEFNENNLLLESQTPSMLLVKQLKELPKILNKQILIIQKFYDENNNYTYEDGQYTELELKEFEIKKIYQCEIVVTNCSQNKMNVSILREIPNGSLPVDSANSSKNHQIQLKRYSSKTFKYSFYFPNEGQYTVYPAVVSTDKAVLAVAEPNTFKVVKKSTIINKDNLEDIIKKGTKDDILEYVKKKRDVSFESISKFLKDKSFYLKCCQIQRDKLLLDYNLLKYSLFHNDLESFKEFLSIPENQYSLNELYLHLNTQFVNISNIRFLEYYPLQTRRVHNLAKTEQGILNYELKQQYISFLNYLVIKQNMNNTDKIIFCYYLLLQSRINEAISIYQGISELKQGEPQLQYDYLTAYLDLYIGYPNFSQARNICEKYISYPIINWRNLFYEVMNLLAEFDGDEDKQIDKTINPQKKDNNEQAQKEEQLEIKMENNQIKLTYANLNQVTIEHYLIDLELVFSQSPFLSDQSNNKFNYIKPFLTYTQELEQNVKQQTINISLPDQVKQKNQFIQVKGGNKIVNSQYIETDLNVQLSTDNGQIRISNQDGKYLEKVYIKTFAKKEDGTILFYKDGYTDLRGRFDYATLDPESLEGLQKFAILIASEDLGSIVKEVDPPSKVGNFVKEVKLQSKLWAGRAQQEQKAQEYAYSKNVMKKCKQ